MTIQILRKLKLRTRSNVHRFFTWGAQLSSTDLVRPVDDLGAPGCWRMRAPHYFPDIDTLNSLLSELSKHGAVSVALNGTSEPFDSSGFSTLAEQVAKRPLPQRQHIQISLKFDGAYSSVSIDFYQRENGGNKARTELRNEDATSWQLNSIANTIEWNAPVLPRRLRKQSMPLIEPVTPSEDTQSRREHEITKTARRSGAFFGLVTSLIVTVISLVIPEIIKNT